MTEAIAAILGAIVGGIIGIVSSHFASKESRSIALDSIKITEHNRAAAKLRSAFAPVQARIKLVGEDKYQAVCNILIDLTPVLAAAIEEFRPFVPEGKRSEYQEAWEDCYQTAMQGASYTAGQAFKREITITEFFEKKIHAVLAFANN